MDFNMDSPDRTTRLRFREPEGTTVTLMPGLGAHRFTMQLTVESVALAVDASQLQLTGEVWSDYRTPRWLGCFAATTLGLRRNAPNWNAQLTMPLTSEQIMALEEERDGHELQLKIDFRGVLSPTDQYPVIDRQETLRIPASEWERQVEGINRGLFFTVAVPIPLDGGPLAEVAQHLRRADHQITAGEYTDSIRETRLAVTVMRDMKVWPKDVTKKRDDQDQADRYGVMLDRLDAMAEGYTGLIQGAFNQASGIQHKDGAIGRATWVRGDAVALLGMAASLMHRLADEIQR